MQFHPNSFIFHALQSAKNSCDSNYVNIDPSNYQCVSDVAAIDAVRRLKHCPYLDLLHHKTSIFTKNWVVI